MPLLSHQINVVCLINYLTYLESKYYYIKVIIDFLKPRDNNGTQGQLNRVNLS